jgi:hypothetical protein
VPREERTRAPDWDRSADHIRASGHNGCTQRSNTWLHPNVPRKVRFFSLAPRTPSIHGMTRSCLPLEIGSADRGHNGRARRWLLKGVDDPKETLQATNRCIARGSPVSRLAAIWTRHSICKVQTHANRQTPNAIKNKINAATKMKMVADVWRWGRVDARVRDEFSLAALIDDAKLNKRG